MLNRVMLIGRLGRDPELRYTQNGSPVASLRIATDESYTDKDGQRVDRTEWHSVVVFQRSAENCNQYLRKGSLVYVEGKLTTRKWQDQNGQDRYTTEVRADRVQFLDRKGSNPGEGAAFPSRIAMKTLVLPSLPLPCSASPSAVLPSRTAMRILALPSPPKPAPWTISPSNIT